MKIIIVRQADYTDTDLKDAFITVWIFYGPPDCA